MGMCRGGAGRDAGGRYPVESAFEVQQRLGPQTPQQRNLFLDTRPTAMEVLAQADVFHLIPADTDTEYQAPAGNEIKRGGPVWRPMPWAVAAAPEFR